jgi:hypothetical protein
METSFYDRVVLDCQSTMHIFMAVPITLSALNSFPSPGYIGKVLNMCIYAWCTLVLKMMATIS